MKKNILLLHGWDYEQYTKQTTDKDAWDYCKELIEALKKNYNVYTLNFPGFCGEKEPKKEWNVEDFASYVNDYVNKNKINVDIVLGYSFGGAVATIYKNKYNKEVKLFLVAPAIIRNFDNSKKFAKTPKMVEKLRKVLRNLYVIYVVGTPEMKYGTKFLRNTYQIIVRRDLREELEKIDPDDIILIYGDKDDAVNPELMNETLSKDLRKKVVMIKGADHDNIVTDYVKELSSNIKKL